MFIANPRIDGPPRGLEAVHLGQHVADHVGERKDDEPAVGDDRAECDALRRGHVGDDHQRGEDRDETRIVRRPDLSECGVLALRWRSGRSVTRTSDLSRAPWRDAGRQLVGDHGVGQRRRERDRAGEVFAGEDIAVADGGPQLCDVGSASSAACSSSLSVLQISTSARIEHRRHLVAGDRVAAGVGNGQAHLGEEVGAPAGGGTWTLSRSRRPPSSSTFLPANWGLFFAIL